MELGGGRKEKESDRVSTIWKYMTFMKVEDTRLVAKAAEKWRRGQ
jgi:hypothetical protein